MSEGSGIEGKGKDRYKWQKFPSVVGRGRHWLQHSYQFNLHYDYLFNIYVNINVSGNLTFNTNLKYLVLLSQEI